MFEFYEVLEGDWNSNPLCIGVATYESVFNRTYCGPTRRSNRLLEIIKPYCINGKQLDEFLHSRRQWYPMFEPLSFELEDNMISFLHNSNMRFGVLAEIGSQQTIYSHIYIKLKNIKDATLFKLRF